MSHPVIDWRVTVILELDRTLQQAEFRGLCGGRSGRNVLPVTKRGIGDTVVSVSMNTRSDESMDAVAAAVHEMEIELGALANPPSILRVRQYLAAGVPQFERAVAA